MNDAELRGEKTKEKKMDIEDEKGRRADRRKIWPGRIAEFLHGNYRCGVFHARTEVSGEEHSTSIRERTGDRIEKSPSGGFVDCY